ncbi:hypothetical protein IGI04_030292 [Brassica rapa subsp. trilocularis]|uniref:Uncharacterized protein n=1 Tax=Brassica rapa subsp. trilocularis TaxID=1813537 RepID=A0ABQ7LSM8_BRACM|nr:hypothetical protein IGI04_030292 [Brassica rapa subsp. trilocularis]
MCMLIKCNLFIVCDPLQNYFFSDSRLREGNLILHLSIVIDVPREKTYHLKPRLLRKVIVVKYRYEVISTKIKKSLLKAEIITWVSLEHGKQPAVLSDPNFLNRFSTFYFLII